MHIHLPKPLHGWRALAGEIGIIVVGVLIALGAEQAVDAVRDGHKADEARTEIRAEIAQNVGEMAVRLRTDNCVRSRLDEIGALLDARAAGQSPAQPIWIGRPQTFVMNSNRLAAVTSAGRASLLSQDEQASYGQMYAAFAIFNDLIERERPAWAKLQILEEAPPSSPPLDAELRLARQEAKYDRARAAQVTHEALRDAELIGVKPDLVSWRPKNSGGGMIGACIPLHTPRAQALDLFYGRGDRTSEP
ncbi:MAG TPA: hypothetical protein VGL66_18700 [Caulobacteraceae bacterium]|jgi:hypothetical protein